MGEITHPTGILEMSVMLTYIDDIDLKEYILTFHKISLAAAIAVCPAVATAQTIAEGAVNAYFAPATVVTDHPQCSGPGEVAYQLEFEGSDLSFSVEHAFSGAMKTVLGRDNTPAKEVADPGEPSPVVEIAPIVVEEEERPRCFITQRRGVESMRVEIECNGALDPIDPFARLATSDLSLAVSAQASVCVSLAGFRVLEGAWTAELDAGLESASYSGAAFAPTLPDCDAPAQTEHPQVQLNYVMPGIVGNPNEWRGPRLRQEEKPAAAFWLRFEDVPIPKASGGISTFAVTANTYFFPTFDGTADCPDGICRPPTRRWHWLPRPRGIICD